MSAPANRPVSAPVATPSRPAAQQPPRPAQEVANATPAGALALRGSTTPQLLRRLRALSVITTLLFGLLAAVAGYQAQAAADQGKRATEQYVRLSTVTSDLLAAQSVAADDFAGSGDSTDPALSAHLQSAASGLLTAAAADPGREAELSAISRQVTDYATVAQEASTTKKVASPGKLGAADSPGKDDLDRAAGIVDKEAVPALATLTDASRASVEHSAASVSRWWIVLPGALALAALLASAVLLALRTHRVLNVGVTVSIIATALAMALAGTALASLHHTLSRTIDNDFSVTHALVDARADAARAKRAQTDRLLGDDAAKAVAQDARERAGADVQRADNLGKAMVEEPWKAFANAFDAASAAVDSGPRAAAAQAVTDTAAGSTRATFDEFRTAADGAVTSLGEATASAFGHDIWRLRLNCLAAWIASLVAAIAAAAGIGQRLREYQE